MSKIATDLGGGVIHNGSSFILGENTDNPVDACVGMIGKLHELKML